MEILPWNSEGPFSCDTETKSKIEATYKKKDFELCNSPRTTFYGNSDDEAIMICEDELSCQVSFACMTEEQFEQIQKVLSIRS